MDLFLFMCLSEWVITKWTPPSHWDLPQTQSMAWIMEMVSMAEEFGFPHMLASCHHPPATVEKGPTGAHLHLTSHQLRISGSHSFYQMEGPFHFKKKKEKKRNEGSREWQRTKDIWLNTDTNEVLEKSLSIVKIMYIHKKNDLQIYRNRM